MKKILFVYNANSDTLSATLDFLHKIISPNTYQCSLCAITFGNFGIRQEWKKFIKELPIETIFLHKDEFKKLYPEIQIDLPIVYFTNNTDMQMVVSSEEMKLMDLNTLMDRVSVIVKQNQ